MTDANTQAIADALQRLKDATERHKAALNQLEDFDHIIFRLRGSSIPVTSWRSPSTTPT